MSKRVLMQQTVLGHQGVLGGTGSGRELMQIWVDQRRKGKDGYDVVDGRLISGREPNRGE